MDPGRTTYSVHRKGYHLVIDDVPAVVCSQCGEPYFEEDSVRLIQEMIRDVDQRAERIHAAAGA
jgi:YgiT-type zinc finger domain-containing protein